MAYTKHQLEYWRPICGDCVLYPSVAQCHRLADMSERGDRYYARHGCLLAVARIHGMEPRRVVDLVRVAKNEDGDIVLLLSEAFYETD